MSEKVKRETKSPRVNNLKIDNPNSTLTMLEFQKNFKHLRHILKNHAQRKNMYKKKETRKHPQSKIKKWLLLNQ
jgi:hypothetical protein